MGRALMTAGPVDEAPVSPGTNFRDTSRTLFFFFFPLVWWVEHGGAAADSHPKWIDG